MKLLFWYWHRHAERGAGEHLAVGAVAQADLRWIDFAAIDHLTAMAGSLDVHEATKANLSRNACLLRMMYQQENLLRYIADGWEDSKRKYGA